jgi:hypothetical protein
MITLPSVIVDDLHIERVTSAPPKNDSPLIVNPDRMETLSISFQSLEPIARWRPKVPQIGRFVEIQQFPACCADQIGWKRPSSLGPSVVEEISGQSVPERFDHVPMLSEFDNQRKLNHWGDFDGRSRPKWSG